MYESQQRLIVSTIQIISAAKLILLQPRQFSKHINGTVGPKTLSHKTCTKELNNNNSTVDPKRLSHKTCTKELNNNNK